MNDMQPLPELPTMVARQFLFVAPENPRSNETIDDDQIHDLMMSIAANGLLSPLIAYQQGHNFYVTAGGRRVRAIQSMRFDELDDRHEEPAWPVIVMDKATAIHAGNAEQLSHVAMDDADELRLFQLPAYASLPDEVLGARLGRPPRYVAQRREILHLPADMLEAAFGRKITIDQAIGLTYAKEFPATQAEFFQRAVKEPRFDMRRMRDDLSNQVQGWDSYCHSQLVTRTEYLAAGGRLQEDLFTGNPLVLDPQVLLQVATEKARDIMKSRYPNAAFIRELGEDEQSHEVKTHRGIYGLTDEEREEWRALSWFAMDDAKKLAEEGDEDTGEIDPEDVAKWEHMQARRADLEPRATYTFPPELEAKLGVAWRLRPGSAYDYRGDRVDPLSTVEHVLPIDLAPLVKAGFIEPAPAKEPEAEVALEDKISAAHAMRIERVRTHALRMELSKSADEVLKIFAVHLSGKLGRSVCFSIDPEQTAHPDPEMAVTWSVPWRNMEALAAATPDEIRALPGKSIRELLAYRILMCLTLRSPQAKDLTPATIRRWWTPDASFLSAYSKTQLLTMLKTIKPEDDFSKEKRGALAEILARLVEKDMSFLPFGF